MPISRAIEIDGWMEPKELEWLYQRSCEMQTVAEIGSYMGRSTYVLLASGAQVTAVDHFRGSPGERAHAIARGNGDGIYRAFMANVGHFPNLRILQTSSLNAARLFADQSFDMVFLDACHSYEAVKADIAAWKPKARYLLCGHDYHPSWPGVVKAVEECLGAVETCGSIWYVPVG